MKTIVHNPFDGEPIAEVPLIDWLEIDKWLNEAQSLHRDRSAWLPVPERIAILSALPISCANERKSWRFRSSGRAANP